MPEYLVVEVQIAADDKVKVLLRVPIDDPGPQHPPKGYLESRWSRHYCCWCYMIPVLWLMLRKEEGKEDDAVLSRES